ncbi:hypothetical protein [Streptomyces sp. NBC_01373]|uniref:hypothetical protein n=1 Tax=Streptomyces sp. NBC_01373 TaxID=2903843 RepID=UPI002252686B|nr:hypothetical protein [Streptomyces sp. NBC_01373]MCX4703921.1 hypothetical protein [Streptomyces sp. NBC_01373]
MRRSRRWLADQNERLTNRNEQLDGAITEAVRNERATASQLLRIAGELSTAKDVIASHIVAAGHPSTVLHDPKAFAESLRQALSDAGVDLQIELARLEGADL